MRFVLKYIQARTSDNAVGQRVHQRRFIDHRATRDVHDISLRTQGSQHLGIDHVMGTGAAWRDQCEHVNVCRQGLH